MPELAFAPVMRKLKRSSKSATLPFCQTMKLFSGGLWSAVTSPVIAPSSTRQKLMSGDFQPSRVLPSKIGSKPDSSPAGGSAAAAAAPRARARQASTAMKVFAWGDAIALPSPAIRSRGMKRPANQPWVPTRAQLDAAKDKTLPGRDRAGAEGAVLRHQPRPLHRRHRPPLRPAGQPLLADAARGRVHAAAAVALRGAGTAELGYGITNVVDRATAAADELTPEDYLEGGKRLVAKVERYKPKVLAVLGVGAYRAAFGRKKAKVGRQDERIGDTEIWVLPNPSGLNAHYQKPEMANVFRELQAQSRRGDGTLRCGGRGTRTAPGCFLPGRGSTPAACGRRRRRSPANRAPSARR